MGEKKQSRRERIASLKTQIEAGTYKIDPAQLSKKIVEAHLRKQGRKDPAGRSNS